MKALFDDENKSADCRRHHLPYLRYLRYLRLRYERYNMLLGCAAAPGPPAVLPAVPAARASGCGRGRASMDVHDGHHRGRPGRSAAGEPSAADWAIEQRRCTRWLWPPREACFTRTCRAGQRRPSPASSSATPASFARWRSFCWRAQTEGNQHAGWSVDEKAAQRRVRRVQGSRGVPPLVQESA